MFDEKIKAALKKETERYIAQDILYDDVYVGPFTEKDGVDCAIHAVNWYLDNVWHDTSSEEPKEEKNLLLMFVLEDGRKVFSIGLYSIDSQKVWVFQNRSFHWMKLSHYSKWAYIEDLLPVYKSSDINS